MKSIAVVLLFLPLSLNGQSLGDYPIHTLNIHGVTVNDPFWTPRIDTNTANTIPHLLDQCIITGRIDNFLRASGKKQGMFQGWWFNDSDVYKSLEAAAWSLMIHPDPMLEARVDSIIAEIAAAQEPDGYLFTPRRTTTPEYRYARYIGTTRWDSVQHSHELYDLGHLYEASIAYYNATGKRVLLDVAIKSANLLLKTFGPGKSQRVPGHQEIEIGLIKLYRATGNAEYARLAKFFLDGRGTYIGRPSYGEYSQDHLPVVQQSEAVGHAVRALYMYSGMADVVATFGDSAYSAALDRLWADVVGKKTYVTGGIGAAGDHEGFAGAYELPNLSAYCETCAAIANVLWNYRMFRLHGDARYIDVLERTLYNGLASGVAADGRTFFYANPLESDRNIGRTPWFAVACCPPNIGRIIPQVKTMTYAYAGDRAYINLFVSGSATLPLDGGAVRLRQEGRYPWDGSISVFIDSAGDGQSFALYLRVPGWARNEAIPLDLYRFGDRQTRGWTVSVNGKPVPSHTTKGYVVIDRKWRRGDVVVLDLPMEIRRVLARDELKDDVNKVVLQRGPIVFCAEGVDGPGGRVSNVMLKDDAASSFTWDPSFPGSGAVIRTSVVAHKELADHSISTSSTPLTLIPYYAWAQRSLGEMVVWLPRTSASVRPLPPPTIASTATPTASGGDPHALNDQRIPSSSTGREYRYLHWWPRKGTKEWVEYAFPSDTTVSSVSVYWYDDTGIGECRVPTAWRLLYRSDSAWVPVEHPSEFGTRKDLFNSTTFSPVRTRGLRIEVDLPKSFSAGIHEWQVH